MRLIARARPAGGRWETGGRWRVAVAGALVLLLLALPSTALPAAGTAPSGFDPATGNAGIEVIIPLVIPAIFTTVSPTAGDASLVLRITTLVTNAWFDAIAPYHESAVGVESRLGRRPVEERTQANKNVAMIYASYRVLNSLLPQHASDWRQMLESAGLDPDDDSEDVTTPVGIGNAAGNAIVAAREHDGMNQLGDEGGRTNNLQPYADYTGYEPVNTAYELRDPKRWQPAITSTGAGIFRVQQFVTPQYARTEALSYDSVDEFRVPTPAANAPGRRGRDAYKAQTDVVLAASAALSDEQKLSAELFDNKLLSLGFSALFASQSQGLTLDEFVQLDFVTNLAAFDTGIAVWKEKRRHDAVRPFSAIRHLYGDGLVTAWGGPGMGTVQLPADEWNSYLPVADHPEYPSGSAAFCAAHAEASRLFLGSDNLGWVVPYPAGSSRIEPGITPAQDTQLAFPTWSKLEQDCGQSRLWAGVHFQAAINASKPLGTEIAGRAYDFMVDHIAGTAPAP